MNHLELWIDGTKIGNYSGATMDASVAEAVGSHTATVIEVDSKGSYVKSTPVTYTVGTSGGDGCAAPSEPGVNVCAPENGADATSPVKFEATGRGASGTVNHLELWIDGAKIGNYAGGSMDANVTVATGSHEAQVAEVDSEGDFVKSPDVNFMVTSTAAVAWVFAADNGMSQNPASPFVAWNGVEADGNTTQGGSIGIPEYTNYLTANMDYVFAPQYVSPTQSEIVALKIAASGSLTQGAVTNTSAVGNQGEVFMDRAGENLYSFGTNNGKAGFTSWSMGTNGALTQVGFAAAASLGNGVPNELAFTANNTYAYDSDCTNESAIYGFSRGTNGALAAIATGAVLPSSSSGYPYCPEGAAVPDNSHVVIALLHSTGTPGNQNYSGVSFAVYTIGAKGTLSTTSTSANMASMSGFINSYAFDPTGTWLAVGDGNGLDLYKFSNGTLTHVSSAALREGVAQVLWDKSGHIYVVGQYLYGGTGVYNVSSTGELTPAQDFAWGGNSDQNVEAVVPLQ